MAALKEDGDSEYDSAFAPEKEGPYTGGIVQE